MKHVLMLSIILSACSMNKIAVRSASSLLNEGAVSVEKEKNWDFFQQCMPTNIKTMEGMLAVDPHNKLLLLNILKGHIAYGYGVSESLYLEDQLTGVDAEDSVHYTQAVSHYTQALVNGLAYLAEKGVTQKDLVEKQDPADLKKFLKKKMSKSKDDQEAIFFTAQAWGSLINLERTNIKLMSYLGTVKNMMDFVCEQNPEINFGACSIFYGAFEAGRPRTLGGNPELGKEIFKNSIVKSPDNLLNRVAYLQYSVIPAQDENEFKAIMSTLDKDSKLFLNYLNLYGVNAEDLLPMRDDRVSVYNAIAVKRYQILKKLEKKIF